MPPAAADGPCSAAPGPVVAIDGPSGVGKSTVARLLARRLQIAYLDSGALYRAVAWKALEAGVDVGDDEAVARVLRRTRLQAATSASDTVTRVQVDGRWIGEQLRSPRVSSAASIVATQPAVRSELTTVQRRSVPPRGAVVEGRDIGSVVFPDTPYKFFLEAQPEVRAERRLGELQRSRPAAPRQDVIEELERRDRRDRERSLSPLTVDASYRLIDTSDLSVEQVVCRIESAIRERGGLLTASPC